MGQIPNSSKAWQFCHLNCGNRYQSQTANQGKLKEYPSIESWVRHHCGVYVLLTGRGTLRLRGWTFHLVKTPVSVPMEWNLVWVQRHSQKWLTQKKFNACKYMVNRHGQEKSPVDLDLWCYSSWWAATVPSSQTGCWHPKSKSTGGFSWSDG